MHLRALSCYTAAYLFEFEQICGQLSIHLCIDIRVCSVVHSVPRNTKEHICHKMDGEKKLLMYWNKPI